MKPFSFYLITDTHYFAPEFYAPGKAYNDYMSGEQKCCGETDAINRAVLKWLGETEDTDTVLIAGDLSFNGEKRSHECFLQLLGELKAKGKRIFVITAGHDFNARPTRFTGDGREPVEGTDRHELLGMYYEYGFSDAIAVDEESLSYVAQLTDGVRLLALNNDGDYTGSKTFTARQTEWILRQTKKAREDGQMMIAMNHYPILPANPVFALVDNAVMENGDNMADLLADEGVHLVFTGHMHNQSIKCRVTEHGNRFWDVCTGSVIACPAFMRRITVKDHAHVGIESIPVPEFEWKEKNVPNEEYYRRQFDMMINGYLDSAEHDPDRVFRKVGVKNAPGFAVKLLGRIGKGINTATLGGIAKKLHIDIDPALKEKSFREFALGIVRNMFTGNAPYVEGTPEYAFITAALGRFSLINAAVSKFVKVGGKPLDIGEIVKYTVGHYGVDENDTEITLC